MAGGCFLFDQYKYMLLTNLLATVYLPYMMTSSQYTIHQFPVIVHEDESNGYWAECPAMDGCYSQGATIDDALKNIREAIELCLEDVPKKTHTGLARQGVSLHFVQI